MMKYPRVAPVQFLGIQEGYGSTADFALYNATAGFGSVLPRSTVTRRTIALQGYEVPPAELAREQEAWLAFPQQKPGTVPATA